MPRDCHVTLINFLYVTHINGMQDVKRCEEVVIVVIHYNSLGLLLVSIVVEKGTSSSLE